MTETTSTEPEAQKKWKPDIIQPLGLYLWPPQPQQAFKWLKKTLINPRFYIHMSIVLVTWFFLTPDLVRMRTFELDWILLIYFRNAGFLVLVVGAVHYRLYIQKAQGTQYKYNPKWPKTNNPIFLFGNQTKDNMFWCIASGCTIWTAYEVLTYWMFANGYLPFRDWLESPVYFVILFLAVGHIHQHHFFFIHRLLHWKPLYKAAHYLHHNYTNPGPWSGFSMHPIEPLLYLSGVLIYWIIPAHPLHAIYVLQIAGIRPVWGHCGFDKFVFNKIEINNGGYDHYMHHRDFECNYGTPDLPWDKMFGYLHDGSEETHQAMVARMKQKHA